MAGYLPLIEKCVFFANFFQVFANFFQVFTNFFQVFANFFQVFANFFKFLPTLFKFFVSNILGFPKVNPYAFKSFEIIHIQLSWIQSRLWLAQFFYLHLFQVFPIYQVFKHYKYSFKWPKAKINYLYFIIHVRHFI